LKNKLNDLWKYSLLQRFKSFEIYKKYNSYEKYDFKKMVINIEDLIIN